MIHIEPRTEPRGDALELRWQPTPDDRRTRIGAWAFAVAGHALLFTLYFPAATPPPSDPPVRAVPWTLARIPRPAPPPPTEPPPEKPPEAAVRRPIPGPPTPVPEPLEAASPTLAPAFELPPTDELFPIPESPPPEEPAGILRVTGDVRAPIAIDQPEPRYTEIARKQRVEGLVILEAVIDTAGRVTDVRVLRGLPMGLEQEAVSAVRRWRYTPATLHGLPVPVLITVTVSFRLQ